VGLHYHYGTLGQLQHGENYADAYLRTISKAKEVSRPLKKWPYRKGSPIRLFIMTGHRNMEGERAFMQELAGLEDGKVMLQDNPKIAFRYSLGGGFRESNSWEPLGLTGHYDNFGPELSFGQTLQTKESGNIAIAKFTHSGSQIIDWTPVGSMAESRNIYTKFITFVRESIDDLKGRGHQVDLAGIFYHLGENDMSFHPYRKEAAERLQTIIAQSRKDLTLPKLKWFVSQQPPTDDKHVNSLDVVADVTAAAAADASFFHIKAFDLPPQEKKLVITTEGIVRLGELIARGYLESK
jgi:hypothetical protein